MKFGLIAIVLIAVLLIALGIFSYLGNEEVSTSPSEESDFADDVREAAKLRQVVVLFEDISSENQEDLDGSGCFSDNFVFEKTKECLSGLGLAVQYDDDGCKQVRCSLCYSEDQIELEESNCLDSGGNPIVELDRFSGCDYVYCEADIRTSPGGGQFDVSVTVDRG